MNIDIGMRFFAFCCRGDLQIAHIDGRALIINIGTVRKGLFLVRELQIEWTICKLNGRFANQVGYLQNQVGELHHILRCASSRTLPLRRTQTYSHHARDAFLCIYMYVCERPDNTRVGANCN